jgi:predicted metal-dependent peptidase
MLSRLPPPPQDGSPAGQPGAGCGSGCDGLPRDRELPPDADVGAVDPDDTQQIRRRVAIDYREHVTSRGTEPGDALRWANKLLEPRIAWEPLLSGAVRRAVGWVHGRTDPTYARPSRRQCSSPSVVLPGLRRPLPAVAMVVDTSGSVDDRLLGRAMGEVDGALRSLGIRGEGVTVLSCDAAVHTVARVRRARDAQLGGGGGTDMRVGLTAAGELRPRPDLVVVFTDGYTPWPDTPPTGAAVVAANLGRERDVLPPSPGWATRVECLLDS